PGAGRYRGRVASARVACRDRRRHVPGVRIKRVKVATAPEKEPGLAERLEKLGIRSKLDLALHLPLRYEDETKLTPLADARPGEPVQVEAEVVSAEVQYRGRRTLVVKMTDG